MTSKALLARGLQYSTFTGSDVARQMQQVLSTQARWSDLVLTLAARRSNIRAIARRRQRQAGFPLTPLAYGLRTRKPSRKS